MRIIGCDFHTRYQQIAMMDDATGELTEQRLEHENGEAEAFYRGLPQPVRVGIEATGPVHWFERLLGEFGRVEQPCDFEFSGGVSFPRDATKVNPAHLSRAIFRLRRFAKRIQNIGQ